MRSRSKIILGTLLGLVNGYFLGVWRQEWMDANDVARQWIRLIIPVVMLVASVGILLVVWITDKVVGRGKTRTSNQVPEDTARKLADPQR